METFQKGDVVKLKSGGPKMTVYDVPEGGTRINCQWFVNDQVKSGSFDAVVLKKVEET